MLASLLQLKGMMSDSSGTGCPDFFPVSSLHFIRERLGKRHINHMYTLLAEQTPRWLTGKLGVPLEDQINWPSASSLIAHVAVLFCSVFLLIPIPSCLISVLSVEYP